MEAIQSWKLESGIYYFTATAYLLVAILCWVETFLKEGLSHRLGLALTYLGLIGNTAALLMGLLNLDTTPVKIDSYRLISNYEFLLAFTWFTVLLHLLQTRRYKFRASGAFVMPLVFGLLAYGLTINAPDTIEFSSIAVYRSKWLIAYVLTSALAYSSFAISFGFGIIYLLKNYLVKSNPRSHFSQRLPGLEQTDELGYRLVLHGFPFFSVSLVIGAAWAYLALGKFWSWEPKETWSLISWLAYVAYLHARLLYGWRGSRSAWMTVMGFLAVLFTFIGVSYFLPGQNIFGL